MDRGFGLDAPAQVAFLAAVAPKVDAYAGALQAGSAHCSNLGAVRG